MREFTNTKYHIEVSHKPEEFERDMDFISSDPESAYKHYQNVAKRDHDKRIEISEITEVINEKNISVKRLKELKSIALKSL